MRVKRSILLEHFFSATILVSSWLWMGGMVKHRGHVKGSHAKKKLVLSFGVSCVLVVGICVPFSCTKAVLMGNLRKA